MLIRMVWVLASIIVVLPCAWPAHYYFQGEVTEATGGFETLTPTGTEVWSLLEFSDTAVQSGEAGSSDLSGLDIKYGGFCFPLGISDCGGDGSIVSFLPGSNTAVQFDEFGNIESGMLVGTAFSPAFHVSPIIIFDFNLSTISVDGFGLGITKAEGELFAVELVDLDADGLFDFLDNCVAVANPAQLDTNSDGIGNACDPDIDNNCVVNFLDFFLVSKNFGLSATDTDLTGDGMVDFSDIAIVRDYFGLAPGPSGNDVCP